MVTRAASRSDEDAGAPTFDIFLSYCQSADHELAAVLQVALERFAKPWHKKRAMRVFRDSSTLGVEEALWPTVRAALRSARHFVLLACPEAASSRWVRRELEERMKVQRSVLIVLTGGELVWDADRQDFSWSQTTALPSMLSGYFASEPLYLDLRWIHATRDEVSVDDARFRDAVAGLVASVRGVEKSELLSEAHRQHVRTMRIMWAAIAVLATLTLTLAVVSWLAVTNARRANELAEKEATQSEALHDNISAANELVDVIVFEELPRLEEIDGSAAMQYRILAKLLELQDSLRDQTHGSLMTDHNRVIVQLKLGDIALSNGNLEIAREAYAAAHELARQRADEGISLHSIENVAIALKRLGDVARASGDEVEAKRRYDRSAAIYDYIERKYSRFGHVDPPRSLTDKIYIERVIGGPRAYMPSPDIEKKEQDR